MRRLVVVIAVYYLIFGYAQLSAAALVFPGWHPGTLELLALLVGPAAGWLSHQASRNTSTRWVLRFVYLWVGLGFLLLCVVVPVQLLRLIGLPDHAAAGVARSRLRAAGNLEHRERSPARGAGGSGFHRRSSTVRCASPRSATSTWDHAPAASFRGSCAGSTHSSRTWCS